MVLEIVLFLHKHLVVIQILQNSFCCLVQDYHKICVIQLFADGVMQVIF